MARRQPIKTRQYNSLKYRYTADNGDEFIRVYRDYKNRNGESFIPLTPLFLQRVLPSATKDKLWSNNDNLRRAVVTYYEPAIIDEQAETTVVIPYRPLDSNCEAHFKEIRETVKATLNALQRQWCCEYEGEYRETYYDKPIEIEL